MEIHEIDRVPFESLTCVNSCESDASEMGFLALRIELGAEHIDDSSSMESLFNLEEIMIVTGDDGEGLLRIFTVGELNLIHNPIVFI